MQYNTNIRITNKFSDMLKNLHSIIPSGNVKFIIFNNSEKGKFIIYLGWVGIGDRAFSDLYSFASSSRARRIGDDVRVLDQCPRWERKARSEYWLDTRAIGRPRNRNRRDHVLLIRIRNGIWRKWAGTQVLIANRTAASTHLTSLIFREVTAAVYASWKLGIRYAAWFYNGYVMERGGK